MLNLQGVTYIHQDRDLLFENLNLHINKHEKIALTGNNGTGKSTLLKILSGSLQPSSGTIKTETKPYYVPQHFGQYDDLSIAEVLQIDRQLKALYEILNGNVSDLNLAVLNDDWTIEARCAEALKCWKLASLDLNLKMRTLSGGQKTKIFLAGIFIHQPKIVLLDEPSNHLDADGRTLLYGYITSSPDTLVIVSHDRALLNLLNIVCELNKNGITVHNGNYESFADRKTVQNAALDQELKDREKALRKAKDVEKATLERQQRLDARGKKKQEKAGLSRISMNTLKNTAEKSTSRVKGIHAGKVNEIARGLMQLRKELPDKDKIKVNLEGAHLHSGKLLISASNVNFSYNDIALWSPSLSFKIAAGDRIALKGANGSGKTTLIKLLLGQLLPQSGTIKSSIVKAIYIDQDYSLIDNRLSIYEQAQSINSGILAEHEIKVRLNRFLFTKEFWNRPSHVLSGGEKMRLMLCCLTIAHQAPDIIILDEPTNNLDIQNIEILTSAVQEYTGTLLVVSHDEYFLEEINIVRTIILP